MTGVRIGEKHTHALCKNCAEYLFYIDWKCYKLFKLMIQTLKRYVEKREMPIKVSKMTFYFTEMPCGQHTATDTWKHVKKKKKNKSHALCPCWNFSSKNKHFLMPMWRKLHFTRIIISFFYWMISNLVLSVWFVYCFR